MLFTVKFLLIFTLIALTAHRAECNVCLSGRRCLRHTIFGDERRFFAVRVVVDLIDVRVARADKRRRDEKAADAETRHFETICGLQAQDG